MVKNKGDLDNSDFSLIILKYSFTGKKDQVQILKSLLFRAISPFLTVQFYLSPQVISLNIKVWSYFDVLYTYRLMGQNS